MSWLLCLLACLLPCLILPRRSRILPTLTNSDGQISGQWVKPKYSNKNSPLKSAFVTGLPVKSTRVHGPPNAGLPYVVTLPRAICIELEGRMECKIDHLKCEYLRKSSKSIFYLLAVCVPFQFDSSIQDLLQSAPLDLDLPMWQAGRISWEGEGHMMMVSHHSDDRRSMKNDDWVIWQIDAYRLRTFTLSRWWCLAYWLTGSWWCWWCRGRSLTAETSRSNLSRSHRSKLWPDDISYYSIPE